MKERVRVLRQVVRQSLYVVDEQAVAQAIVARGSARVAVANAGFHSDQRGPKVRSFRRDPAARSFRLGQRGSARERGS